MGCCLWGRTKRTRLKRLSSSSSSSTQLVENPSVMQEILVQALGQEDALEKGRAAHSSILAWRIPWTQKPGGLQSMESQRVAHDCAFNHTV